MPSVPGKLAIRSVQLEAWMYTHTNGIDLPGFDNLKTTIPVIVIIRWTRQRRTNPSMDIRVVPE